MRSWQLSSIRAQQLDQLSWWKRFDERKSEKSQDRDKKVWLLEPCQAFLRKYSYFVRQTCNSSSTSPPSSSLSVPWFWTWTYFHCYHDHHNTFYDNHPSLHDLNDQIMVSMIIMIATNSRRRKILGSRRGSAWRRPHQLDPSLHCSWS